MHRSMPVIHHQEKYTVVVVNVARQVNDEQKVRRGLSILLPKYVSWDIIYRPVKSLDL